MSFTDKLVQIELLRQQIEEHGKLPEEVLKKVNYKFRLEWNYNSNSMEGNSLTRLETRSVMVGNITVDGKPIKDVLEMKNHDDVIANIIKVGKGELNVSEKRIKEIHKGIMHEEDPEKAKLIGQWKTAPNYLFNYKNERFDFVAPADVPERMHQLINWLNTQKEKIQKGDKDALHPVMVAFRFHLDYTTIHPFYDGNGRTARILTNLILISYGYPPVYIKQDEKDRYYQYLADIQGYGGEPDLIYDFMAGLLVRSQQIVVDAMEGKEIAEPDDWEKKLSLLKQELNTEDGKQITKSEEAVLKVINKCIIPLIEQVMVKFPVFDELFEQKQLLIGDNLQLHPIINVRQVIDWVARAVSAGSLYLIGFTYQLNGFKKSINRSSITYSLIWRFEQYKYGLFRNAIDQDNGLYKSYGEYLTPDEIDKLVNECASELLESIERMVKQ